MKVGAAKRKITPPIGVELTGFGISEGGDRYNIGVHDDLYVTVLAIQHQEGKALFISADLIGFGLSFANRVKKALGENYGFCEDEIILNASHTHSGPQPMDGMHEGVGRKSNDYVEFLFESIQICVKEALSGMEEGELFIGKAECGFNINRRMVIDGRAEARPNEEGPVDHEVTVFHFTADSKTKCVLFFFACHPSTINTKYVSADYPGAAKKVIEDKLKEFGETDAVAMFMQGCCGDIRVRTIEGDRFRAGTFDDVAIFGQMLGDAVLSVIRLPHQEKIPSDTMKKVEEFAISSQILHFDLPLASIPDPARLESIKNRGNYYQRIWASKMMKEYSNLSDKVPFIVQKISLSDSVSVVAIGGETCIGYALYVKEKTVGKTVVTAGYSNLLPGYIPTADMFPEGGYEPDSSTIYFNLPSAFDPTIEKVIREKLDELL